MMRTLSGAKRLMKKWSSYTIVLFFLVMISVGSTAIPAYAGGGLEMEAQAGFGGYARSGAITPVQVIVENNGSEINAYLEISTLSGEKQVLYRKQAVLASGSKKAIDMYIPANADQSYSVKLVSESTPKVLAEAGLRLSCIEDNGLLVGVLARTEGVLDYLETIGLPGSGRRVTVAYLQEDNIPINELLLDSINVLVFYDYSLNSLSERKSRAIQEWVKRGGILVQGKETYDSSIFNAAGSKDKLTGENPKELVLAGNVSAYYQQLGRGTVYYLIDQDTTGGMEGTNLWQYLLKQADSSQLAFTTDIDGGADTLGLALSTLSGSHLPGLGWLTVIFLIYIAILGPGTYLVLKRLDRREWGWVVVPLLAVFLFSLAYTYGFKGQGWNNLTSIISLVRLEPNNDYARVNSILGVFAPTQCDYTIDLPGQSLVSLLPVEIGGSASVIPNTAAKEPLSAIIEQGEDTRVKFDDATRWSLRYTRSESILHPSGYIASNLKMGNGKVSGTIKNLTGYCLNDCAVLSRYNYQYIGKLEAGASTQIDFIPYIHGQKGAAFQRMEVNYPANWPQQDRSIAIRDKEIKRQLMAMVAGSYNFLDGSLLLVGHSPAAVKGIVSENQTSQLSAATAFASPLLLPTGNTGTVSVPPGIINAHLVAAAGSDCRPDEWGYKLDDSELIFQLPLPCSPSDFNFDELRVFIPGVDCRMQAALRITVFNLVSGAWERVDCKPAGILLNNARQYVDAESCLWIKVETIAAEPSGYDLYFPGFTASFEGSYVRGNPDH